MNCKISAENGWSEVTRGEHYVIRTSSAIIILEGKAIIANEDTRTEVAAGASITISRGVPHAWCNPSRNVPLRMLVVFTPGGLEQIFQKNKGAEPADMIALANKFGTRITGAALFDDLYTIHSPRP